MKPQEILKEAREKSGETQEVIAGKIGVSLRMYQRYEEGKFPKYRSDSIEKLDKLFGTSIYAMLYDKTIRKEPEPPTDPATVILPIGDVKRTLADYINMLEQYNRTLATLVEIKDTLKHVESSLDQGHQKSEEQLKILSTSLGDVQATLLGVNTGEGEQQRVPFVKSGKENDGHKRDSAKKGKGD